MTLQSISFSFEKLLNMRNQLISNSFTIFLKNQSNRTCNTIAMLPSSTFPVDKRKQ